MIKNIPFNVPQLFLIKISKWFNLVMPIVVLFYQDNGLSMTQIFLLKSIYSIAMVATELPSGYLADVWGCRKTLLVGAVLGTIGIIIYSFSAVFLTFAVAEIILGIGFSFISGADTAILYDSLHEELREDEYTKYEGKITSSGNFAEAVAGILGGLLATYSLRTPYFFQIFVASIAIPAAYYLKEPKQFHNRIHLKMNEILYMVKLTYAKPEMRASIMISSLTGGATLTYAWFVQPYFEEAGVPISVFGILWTLLNLTTGIFSIYSYKVEKSLGQKYTLLFIVVFISLGFILSSIEVSLAGISILFGFYLIRGIASPVLKNYINQFTDPKVRATILSVRNFEIRIIFAIAGPILGYITDQFSLKTALLVSGIAYFVSAGLSILPLIKKRN